MSPLEHIKHPIQTLRSAPFAIGIVATNGYGVCRHDLVEESLNVSEVISYVPNSLGLVVGIGLVARQLKFKEKVAEKLADGYNEEFLAKTTGEWCARQTVRTVVTEPEDRERYKRQCDKAENTSFSWLPHW